MEATQRLNGAFFSFAEAGKMTSNITGSPIQGNYAINGQELSQTSDTSSPINYKIELLTPDSLTLTTKLSGIDFKLHLLKK